MKQPSFSTILFYTTCIFSASINSMESSEERSFSYSEITLSDSKKKPLLTDNQKDIVYLSTSLYNASRTLQNCLSDCQEDATAETEGVPTELSIDTLTALAKVDKQISYTLVENYKKGTAQYVADRCATGLQDTTLSLDDLQKAYTAADYLGLDSIASGIVTTLGTEFTKPLNDPNLMANRFLEIKALHASLLNNSIYMNQIIKAAKIQKKLTKLFIENTKFSTPIPGNDNYSQQKKAILINNNNPNVLAFSKEGEEGIGVEKMILQKIISAEKTIHAGAINQKNLNNTLYPACDRSSFAFIKHTKKRTKITFWHHKNKLIVWGDALAFVFLNNHQALAYKKDNNSIYETENSSTLNQIAATTKPILLLSATPSKNIIAYVTQGKNNFCLGVLRKNKSFYEETPANFKIKNEPKKICLDEAGFQVALNYETEIIIHNLTTSAKIKIPTPKKSLDFCFSKDGDRLYVLDENAIHAYVIHPKTITTLMKKGSFTQLMLLQTFVALQLKQQLIALKNDSAWKKCLFDLFLCCNEKSCKCLPTLKNQLKYAQQAFINSVNKKPSATSNISLFKKIKNYIGLEDNETKI